MGRDWGSGVCGLGVVIADVSLRSSAQVPSSLWSQRDRHPLAFSPELVHFPVGAVPHRICSKSGPWKLLNSKKDTFVLHLLKVLIWKFQSLPKGGDCYEYPRAPCPAAPVLTSVSLFPLTCAVFPPSSPLPFFFFRSVFKDTRDNLNFYQ